MMRVDQRSTRPPRDPRYPVGVSLVELVASMAIMSVLIGAMGSAVFLATQALPDPKSTTFTLLDTGVVMNDIAQDLRYAVTFIQRLPNTVEFTVADRDTDTLPETILYQWSGTPGDPLTRQYNGGTVVNVIDSVQQFGLTYNIRSAVDTTAVRPNIESAEQVFIQQDSGNVGDTGTHFINATSGSAQYFLPTLPADAVSWKITRTQFFGQQHGAPNKTMQVSVRPTAAGGEPSTTVLDQVLFLETAMTAETWYEAVFASAGGLDPVAGYFIAFMQVESGGDNAFMLHLGDTGPAYPNTTYYYGNWFEDTQKDVWLWVWGTVTAPDPNWVPPTINYQQSVTIGLQAGTDPRTAIELETAVLNQPVVP